MTHTALTALTALALVTMACSGQPGKITSSASATSSTPRAAANTRAAPKVATAPTRLTEEQKARQRAHAATAEAVLGAYVNVDPELSPDGKSLLFRSDRGGVWEAYVSEVTNPDAPPRKVIAGPEPVQGAAYSRDGRWLLFRRDASGDENYRIFRARPDGSGVVNLTPGENTRRSSPLLPREKPSLMVYTSRAANSPETRVVVQDIARGEPKVVHTDPGPSFIVDANARGTHALIVRDVSLGEQLLFDVELASGSSRRVYPTEGVQAGIFCSAYSADGASILLATDEGKEGTAVLRLDARTFREQARYQQTEPPSAAVVSLTTAAQGNRIALAIDSGAVRTGRLLDAKTLERTADVQLPPGVLDLGSFSADGSQLTFAASTAERPLDVYVANSRTGATKRLRKDETAGVSALPDVNARVETVASFDGQRVPVNLYEPKHPPGSRLPTIVEFHGGPEGSSHLFWKPLNRFFTSVGFAYAEPNIRGSSGFGRAYQMADNLERRPDSFRDMEAVNSWLKTQPWCDGKRVAILGESYGGYLTLVGLTRQPDAWAAGVDLFGPSSLVTFLREGNASARRVYASELGDLDKDRELLESLSPLREVERIRAPLFVFQGANDARVPVAESDRVVSALRQRGWAVEYMFAENEGHSINRHDNRVELLSRIARFLEDAMKQPGTPSDN